MSEPARADWQDPAPYEAILRRGRAGLAWEVLRRDPAYQAAFARLDGAGPASDAFAARWGLHFR
jgi:3-methyladenine DNA glycosylase Tag